MKITVTRKDGRKVEVEVKEPNITSKDLLSFICSIIEKAAE